LIIRVDLHFLPENLKSLIINSKELNQYATTNLDNLSTELEVKLNSIRLFEFNGYFSSFKGILSIVLQDNSINDYIIAEDLDSENTFVVLKEGDIEQLGLILCDFCGLACASEDEKYIHQRAHYFI
jgi:hypothetical protein